MAATFSGTTITITGSGNTLASITSDINNTAVIESMGGGVYNIYGVTVTQITVSDGGELIIGNPNDFSTYEELRFIWQANGSGSFTFQTGSTFKMYGNTKLIANYGSNNTTEYPGYTTFNGNVHIEGNPTYYPELTGARRIVFNPFYTNVATSEFYLKYVKLGNCHQNYIYLSFYIAIPNTLVLDNIIITQSYPIILYGFSMSLNDNYANNYIVPITNLSIDPSSYNVLMSGVYPYLKDSSIDLTNNANDGYWTIVSNTRQVNNNIGSLGFDATSDIKKAVKIGQYIDRYLENVNYITDYGYSFYTYNNTMVLLNNVSANKNTLTYNGGCVMYYNSNSMWSGRTHYLDNYFSCVKLVYKLEPTVRDEYGNLLDDVLITIRSVNNEEMFRCSTDSNGKIAARFGLSAVFLANQLRYSVARTLVYVSDNSNNTYHIVTYSKPGYELQTKNYVMNEDKIEDITMVATSKPITTIYGSTFYNANIY